MLKAMEAELRWRRVEEPAELMREVEDTLIEKESVERSGFIFGITSFNGF